MIAKFLTKRLLSRLIAGLDRQIRSVFDRITPETFGNLWNSASPPFKYGICVIILVLLSVTEYFGISLVP